MKKNIILVLTLFCISIFSSCAKNTQTTQSNDKFFFLNSVMTLNIFDENIDKEKISQEVDKRVQELENELSLNLDDSEVSKINNNAGIKPVEVSDDTLIVVKKAVEYSKLSEGKFDITIGNLVELWGIGTENEKLPTKEEIEKALKTIDYTKIEIDEKNKTIFLQEKGMKLDLGAIAKGYVSDEINKIIKENGVSSAVSNLGGNVYLHGNKNGSAFKVGIRNPLSDDMNDYLGVFSGEDESIVTSGTYERYFEKDGVRYHHIFSTTDGYPINNELLSTSIITKNSIDADALSTITFALGLEEGLKLIESKDEVEAIFITKDKIIYLTSGLKDKFELTNKEFTLK